MIRILMILFGRNTHLFRLSCKNVLYDITPVIYPSFMACWVVNGSWTLLCGMDSALNRFQFPRVFSMKLTWTTL